MMVGKEVLIVDGGHMYENGRVMRENLTQFTVPFVEVHTRTKAGVFRKGRIAFVPMSYCVEFDVQAIEERELQNAAARYGADSDAYKRLVKALAKSKVPSEPEESKS